MMLNTRHWRIFYWGRDGSGQKKKCAVARRSRAERPASGRIQRDLAGTGETYYDKIVARCTPCCGFILVGGMGRRGLEVVSGLATIIMYSLGK